VQGVKKEEYLLEKMLLKKRFGT